MNADALPPSLDESPAPVSAPQVTRSPMQGLSVLVLGLGTSGVAMAAWCLRRGAAVTVWDSRLGQADAPASIASALQVLRDLPLLADQPALAECVGALDASSLGEHQWVLRSPGLGPNDPRVLPLLQAAESQGVPVRGELDLFVAELRRLASCTGYAPKLLAITGTNGKTTTTALTGLLVERAGLRVAVAGNIGPSLLDTLQSELDAAPQDAEAWPQVWVVELSSFQLHGVQDFEPSAAVVLNLSEDHLDWHGSMAAYGADKQRIWGRSVDSTMVVNRDDPIVVRLGEALLQPPAPPAAAASSRTRALRPAAPPLERRVVRFGLDAPRAPGDFGLVVEGGMAWLVRAMDDGEPLRRRRPAATAAAAEPAEPLVLQRLMPADALRIRGRHNAANALAALALATSIGCPLAPMLHGLREYTGEPHRVQFVATVGGIDAFDDSKGTNVGATVAALEGLGQDRAPARLAVILGGDGKGQDFSPLVAALQRHARAVALIGRDASAIELAVGDRCREVGIPLARLDSLEAAVGWCFDACSSGDAVLLSPACASLDMFRDYRHRADVFVAEVQARAAMAGGLS